LSPNNKNSRNLSTQKNHTTSPYKKSRNLQKIHANYPQKNHATFQKNSPQFLIKIIQPLGKTIFVTSQQKLSKPFLNLFLAALSSSRSLFVGPLVRWSAGPLVRWSVMFVKK
jgi:hypothetical protein